MSISKFWKEAIGYRLAGGHAADHKAMKVATFNDASGTSLVNPINGNSVTLANPLALNALSGVTYTSSGLISGYIRDSVSFTISYNANGTINTIVGGGTTQTFSYDSNGNVNAAAIA